MKLLFTELKRAVISYRMIVVIIFMIIVAYRMLILDDVLEHKLDAITLYLDCFASSGITYFVTLAAVIPYSTIFCDEYRSGYIMLIVNRIGYNNYFVRRIISVTFSGAIAIGVSLIIIFSSILIVSEPYDIYNLNALKYGIWYEVIHDGNIYYFFLFKLLIGMMYGGVWAVVGFAFSSVLVNKYVSLAFPVILNLLLWILLSNFSFLNPLLMFRGDFGKHNEFLGSFFYIIMYQSIIYVTMTIIGYIGIKKRLLNA